MADPFPRLNPMSIPPKVADPHGKNQLELAAPAAQLSENKNDFVILTNHGGILTVEQNTKQLVQVACLFHKEPAYSWSCDHIMLTMSDDVSDLLPKAWYVQDAGDGRVAFRTKEKSFLRASPHLGPISFDARNLAAWEYFRLLSLDDYALMACYAQARWLIDGDERPTEPGKLRLIDGFRIEFGGRTVALDDFLIAMRSVSGCRSLDGLPMSFTFIHGIYSASRARLFNPLIYTAIGGANNFFEQVCICFGSIESFGQYDGSYCLVSDRDRSAITPYLESIDPVRWSNIQWDLNELEKIVSARMNVLKDTHFDGFQPILYVDSDVVCDRPIEGLLIAAARSDRILIASEFNGLSIAEVGSPNDNWFGAFLYEGDPRIGSHRCINNGIFAGCNRHVFLEPYGIVAQAWARFKAAYGDAHRAAYDQPFYSYILQGLEAIDTTLMDQWVTNLQGVEPTGSYKPRGLAHFNIGVGKDKTDAMLRYVDLLERRYLLGRSLT